MSRASATDLDDVVDSADDDDAYDLDEMLARASIKKQERKQPKQRAPGSWRAIEDYMEAKRLKRQLREVYDDDL